MWMYFRNGLGWNITRYGTNTMSSRWKLRNNCLWGPIRPWICSASEMTERTIPGLARRLTTCNGEPPSKELIWTYQFPTPDNKKVIHKTSNLFSIMNSISLLGQLYCCHQSSTVRQRWPFARQCDGQCCRAISHTARQTPIPSGGFIASTLDVLSGNYLEKSQDILSQGTGRT